METTDQPIYYPLDDWLKLCLLHNKTLIAKKGEDFTDSIEKFRTTLHNYARKRGIKVRTKIISKDEIKFQFYRRAQ